MPPSLPAIRQPVAIFLISIALLLSMQIRRMVFISENALLQQVIIESVAVPSHKKSEAVHDFQPHTPQKCAPDVTLARSCLQLTDPKVNLVYPEDAWDHFQEINQKMIHWNDKYAPRCREGFCGPWLEMVFAQKYQYLLVSKKNNTRTIKVTPQEPPCLSDIFGPFIPLLIHFQQIKKRGGNEKNFVGNFGEDFVRDLKPLLRRNVPYIAIVQDARGLPFLQDYNNILIVSAGGMGHVPIPLLKQIEQPLPRKAPSKRKWLVSFVGTVRKEGLRTDMRNYMNEALQDDFRFFKGSFDGGQWRNIMLNSRFSLAPRGFGRTSYRLFEIMQMGLIPIHIYDDVPWIPYLKLFQEKLGFVVRMDELPKLVEKMRNMSDEEITQREQVIMDHRKYFTVEFTLEQIEKFMLGGGELECVPFPGPVDILGLQPRWNGSPLPKSDVNYTYYYKQRYHKGGL